ncbi:MAG: hypothetical protein ACYDFT_00205 [Thermoplasmata archaeon]
MAEKARQLKPRPPQRAQVRDFQGFLAADPNLQRWIDDHRAPTTAKVQLEQLELFCRKTGKTPADIVAMAHAKITKPDAREYEDLIRHWMETERKAQRTDSYIALNYAAIRSWLKFHEAVPAWRPKFRGQSGSTVADERVPDLAELRQLLQVLNARGRVIVLMMATTGIRPGVFGRRDRPEGLRLADLPDLTLEPVPTFQQTPFMVVVRAELSKAGARYVTFGTEETSEAITAYLKERLSRGEKLSSDSPLVTVDPRAPKAQVRADSKGHLFLGEDALSNDIRAEMRKVAPAGVRRRLYVWRAFFSTQMNLAEAARLVTHSMIEAWMGHTTNVDQRYNFGKRWNDAVLKEMRLAYARASVHLTGSVAKGEIDPATWELLVTLADLRPEVVATLQKGDVAALTRLIEKSGHAEVEEVVSTDKLKELLTQHVRFTEKMPLGDGTLLVKYIPNGDPIPPK